MSTKDQIKIRFTVDVTYNSAGINPDWFKLEFGTLLDSAESQGGFTAGSDATVESYEYHARKVPLK